MEASEFGICRLSVIAVRKDPADTSEQVTQLLFGEHYEVLDRSKDKRWMHIRMQFDQYTGWIDTKQFQSISKEYFQYISDAEFKITVDITSTMLYNKSPHTILMGSIIPISSTELFKMEEQFAFNGEAKNLGQKREFDFLRTIATRYLNAPYSWGGKSPFGIDCSGFTQMVFKICGYSLLRDAKQQATQGRPVSDLTQTKPGDIAFFQNEQGKVTHTGILIGPDRIIHASGKVRIDQIDEKGIIHNESKSHTHRFAHIRRILPD